MSAWLDGFAGGPFDGRELLIVVGAIALYVMGYFGGDKP